MIDGLNSLETKNIAFSYDNDILSNEPIYITVNEDHTITETKYDNNIFSFYPKASSGSGGGTGGIVSAGSIVAIPSIKHYFLLVLMLVLMFKAKEQIKQRRY